MSHYPNSLQVQIELIEEAMKKAEVWSTEVPDWIRNYKEGPIVNIWQWLQFVHLPLRSSGIIHQPNYLAPQLSNYMNSDPLQRKILQLVIELDSITPTIEKTKS